MMSTRYDVMVKIATRKNGGMENGSSTTHGNWYLHSLIVLIFEESSSFAIWPFRCNYNLPLIIL
jgi:hypothetical protein